MTNWSTNDFPPQRGRLAVVTGGNSGIGWEAALELARAGARVVVAARTAEKGRDAVERIRRRAPRAEVRAEVLDLANLESVHAFAGRVSGEGALDLLVNNAGVMAVPRREVTADGFERQLGTNYIGPFALTGLLWPALERAKAPRVVVVASGAAEMGLRRIRFEDPQWEQGYRPWRAYCQSKLADLLWMGEMARRSRRVVVTGAHPGFARTNLQSTGPERQWGSMARWLAGMASQDAAGGALPTLRAIGEGVTGSYYGPSRFFHLKGAPVEVPIPKPARDREAAGKLWELSEKWTGVRWLASEK